MKVIVHAPDRVCTVRHEDLPDPVQAGPGVQN